MAGTGTTVTDPHKPPGHLTRSVGFYGLIFVTLGSIIGSGWLLGALNAADKAGPASILSWILPAAMLSLFALVHAELGAANPVAVWSGRIAYHSHGSMPGFTAGWGRGSRRCSSPPSRCRPRTPRSTAWRGSTGTST